MPGLAQHLGDPGCLNVAAEPSFIEKESRVQSAMWGFG